MNAFNLIRMAALMALVPLSARADDKPHEPIRSVQNAPAADAVIPTGTSTTVSTAPNASLNDKALRDLLKRALISFIEKADDHTIAGNFKDAAETRAPNTSLDDKLIRDTLKTAPFEEEEKPDQVIPKPETVVPVGNSKEPDDKGAREVATEEPPTIQLGNPEPAKKPPRRANQQPGNDG